MNSANTHARVGPPTVSIIITTYNRKDLVGRTVRSVLEQDYRPIEIIVVDDCSTDGTPESIRSEDWFDQITYVRHERNRGVQHASNTGYERANGEFLAFVGDDDRWSDPSKLSRQVRIFQEDTAGRYGIVTTSVHVIQPERSFDRVIRKPRDLTGHLLDHNGIIYGSAAVLRRDAFEYAGRFAEELPKGTDSDVFRRIVLLGYDVYFLHEAMVDYHEDSPNRMTAVTERAILRSIIGETYKLNRYHSDYTLYPFRKARVLYRLGTHHEALSKIKENPSGLRHARALYLRSALLAPHRLRPWIGFFKAAVRSIADRIGTG
ncbi:MAG TPA: glycosyltransferase family 2 protein [Rhodothermales bacterium]|nr:glycosyltransferase family 2 protein [Rhodothermales bacterium]